MKKTSATEIRILFLVGVLAIALSVPIFAIYNYKWLAFQIMPQGVEVLSSVTLAMVGLIGIRVARCLKALDVRIRSLET